MKPITCGVWTFEPNSLVIQHRTDDYWIDLETCRNSAEILDWIAQLRAKNWVSSRDLGDLVALMDDLLGFQSNFCGCGRSRAGNPVAILEARFGRGFRKKSPAPSPDPPTA